MFLGHSTHNQGKSSILLLLVSRSWNGFGVDDPKPKFRLACRVCESVKGFQVGVDVIHFFRSFYGGPPDLDGGGSWAERGGTPEKRPLLHYEE